MMKRLNLAKVNMMRWRFELFEWCLCAVMCQSHRPFRLLGSYELRGEDRAGCRSGRGLPKSSQGGAAARVGGGLQLAPLLRRLRELLGIGYRSEGLPRRPDLRPPRGFLKHLAGEEMPQMPSEPWRLKSSGYPKG